MYTSLKTYGTHYISVRYFFLLAIMTDFSHQVDKYRLTHTGFIQIGYAF